MVDLKYIGHSAFEFKKEDKAVLVDPLVSTNEKFNWHEEPITDILLTHAHGDHLGEAIEIAREKDIEITAVFELANYCAQKGVRSNGINFGGWLDYDWGRAIFVPAFHSSSNLEGQYMGEPAGVILEISDVKIYHAGDTCLFSDMKLIKELYNPDVVMLPVGGTFTMDIEHATIAAEWLNPRVVIPMHYNTFSAIYTDIERFGMMLQTKGINYQLMQINETLNF